MNKIGRRRSLAGSLLLCGFTCAAGAYVPEGIHTKKKRQKIN